MKKYLSLILVLCLCLCTAVGCGSFIDEQDTEGNSVSTDIESSMEAGSKDETETQDESNESEGNSEDTLDSGSPEGDSSRNEESDSETETVYEGPVDVEFRNQDGSYINTITIMAGETISRPDAPQNVHSPSFYGWYADQACSTRFDFSLPIIENTVIWACWKEYSVCDIKDITVDKESKAVTLSAYTDNFCPVYVWIIDEQEYFADDYDPSEALDYDKAICFGVSSKMENGEYLVLSLTETVELDIPGNFVIEARLDPSYYHVEGDPYTSMEYTQRYKEFIEITPDSFDKEENVVFFDDNQYNFGVLADDVKMIEADHVIETLLDDGFSVIYNVKNPTESIVEGDKVFITSKDGEYGYLFLAEHVEEIDGETVVSAMTVNENNAYKLSSFYKFLRVDMTSEYDVASSNDVAMLADEGKKDPQKKVLLPIYHEKGDLTIEGKVEGVLKAHLICKFSYDLFGDKYWYCSLEVNADLTNTVTFSYEKEEDDIPLASGKANVDIGRATLPIGVYGLNVFADFEATMSYSVSGTLTVENKVDATLGFEYSTKSGFTGIKSCTSTAEITECTGEAEISFGLVPSIGVGFLGELAQGKLQMYLGVEVRGEAKGQMFDKKTWEDMTHNCIMCIDGEVNAKVCLEVMLELNLGSIIPDFGLDDEEDDDDFNFEFKPEKPLYENKWFLFDFYVSILATEEFDRMGLGDCPNHSSATVYVYPYLEECYPEYDPSSGKPYPGVAEGSKYMVPRMVLLTDSSRSEVYAYAFNLDVLRQSFGTLLSDAEIKSEIRKVYGKSSTFYDSNDLITDPYGNEVYRVNISAAHGYYNVGAYYVSETGFYSSLDVVDYGDVSIVVDYQNGAHTLASDDDDVIRIYPQNFPRIVHTLKIKVSYVLESENKDGDIEMVYRVRLRVLGYYGCLRDFGYIGTFTNEMKTSTDAKGWMEIEFAILNLPFENYDCQFKPIVGTGFEVERSKYIEIEVSNSTTEHYVTFNIYEK